MHRSISVKFKLIKYMVGLIGCNLAYALVTREIYFEKKFEIICVLFYT